MGGAAPMDAISDYFDSRARRSEGDGGDGGGLAFTRSLRRTLPFQLVPQPPLAYARSNSYVDARMIYLLKVLFGIRPNDLVQRNYKPSREASASEILSMLEKLTNSREGKRRMRY